MANRRGHAGRIDGNMVEIVDALRSYGCTVQSLAEIGDGCPDLLVGYRKRNYLLEVKDPAQPPNKRRFTPSQKDWHASWRGTANLVETVEQALMVVVGV